MAIKHHVQSLVNALTLPFRLRGIIRNRSNQMVLQNHQIIGRLDRLTARIDRLTNPDQALHDRLEGLVPGKRDLIDFAFQSYPIRSFADLGGAYSYPPGGYALYTVDKYKLPTGFLVDDHAPEGMEEELSKRPGVRFIRGNLALPDVAAQLGRVDAAYLFDVLCMQAAPDWRELLALYARRVKYILITSAQFDCFPRSTRLMDLSEEEYYECVPHEYAVDVRKLDLFAIREEVHPEYGLKHRDCPQYWQWAITDNDLLDTMRGLRFRLAYMKPLMKMDNITKPGVETRGFIFVRE
jgi:hypothetical protein